MPCNDAHQLLALIPVKEKKTAKGKKKIAAKGKTIPPARTHETDGYTGYGILPERDLKKNLGCG